jgi:hypothetical protein
MMRGLRSLAMVAAALFSLHGAAFAGELPKPEGEPILTVGGSIENTNDDGLARFDWKMLESLGTVKIETMTPWYEKPVEFEGVPMKTLMDYVGAKGAEVTVVALNDYKSTVPMEDFEQFDALLAMKRDGEAMPVRDKGPLWLVYPYDTDPELKTDKYYSRSVWQIKEMQVQ